MTSTQADTALKIWPIPAFQDNYIWVLEKPGASAVAIVDPGDAQPTQKALKARGLEIGAILITHHHPDHIGGLPTLLAENDVPVYGPIYESATIPLMTHPLADGDAVQLEFLNIDFDILHVPGHTLGHIAYYADSSDQTVINKPVLLCGDTLFSGGCGRLFEGTPKQMHQSLQKLAAFPNNTQVYCTHEYTHNNLQFAHAVEPENRDVTDYLQRTANADAKNPSLPSNMALEKRINPFLRCDVESVQQAAKEYRTQQEALPDNAEDIAVETFASLRSWKDSY